VLKTVTLTIPLEMGWQDTVVPLVEPGGMPDQLESIPTMNPAQNLLRRAAALLQQRGWIRHSLFASDGFCLLGVLQASAQQDRVAYKEAVERVFAVLSDGLLIRRFNAEQAAHPEQSQFQIKERFCMNWNDRYARGRDEVVSVLNKAMNI
jgi:hypothetical protein